MTQWFDSADSSLVEVYLAEWNVEWEAALFLSAVIGSERTVDEVFDNMVNGWEHGFARRWTN